ncbi:MAG: hypothetical protein QW175_02790 [Candidatus Bathyarchaeia archaeon]
MAYMEWGDWTRDLLDKGIITEDEAEMLSEWAEEAYGSGDVAFLIYLANINKQAGNMEESRRLIDLAYESRDYWEGQINYFKYYDENVNRWRWTIHDPDNGIYRGAFAPAPESYVMGRHGY